MPSSLVSVIIPAYNAEKYILECVNSVLNQTHRNLEIIVINDGSMDKTLDIIRSFHDNRIIFINQDNQGCSSAKNSGLRIASGDFIQYLDADDVLSQDKIEKQLIELENAQNKIAVCKTVFFQDTIAKPCGEIDTELIKKEGTGLCFLLRLLGSEGQPGMVQPNAYLLPKKIVDIIGDWKIEISPSPDEDGEYFARALLAAKQVVFTDGINYYRKNQNQKSLSQIHTPQRALNLLKTVEFKFQYIFELERSKLTERLFQLNISQVAYQYGVEFPLILNDARNSLKGNSFSSLRIDTPFLFARVSRVVGFNFALGIRRLIMKIKWN